MFWGVVVLVIFGVFLAAGRFELWSGARPGGRRMTVITRQENPGVYWGIESSVLAVAVSLLAMGAYRARKGSRGDDG